MSVDEEYIVGQVLEQVIMSTVVRESESTSSASTPVSSLDYSDDNYRRDDFKENQNNKIQTVRGGDIDDDIVMVEEVNINQPSENEEDTTEFVVEKIVKKKLDSRGFPQYQVKWTNYPSSSNTWEPVDHLEDCDKIMQQFEISSAEKLAERHASEEEDQTSKPKAQKKRQKLVAKEYEVNDIMGLTMIEKEKYFLVSLANSTQKTFIRASLANRIIPQKVIDFYIKSMRWKSK